MRGGGVESREEGGVGVRGRESIGEGGVELREGGGAGVHGREPTGERGDGVDAWDVCEVLG